MLSTRDIILRAKLFYSASGLVARLSKTVTSSVPYSFFLKPWIKHQIGRDRSGPFNMVVELSNLCNARCLMCPHHTMRRSLKVMETAVFELLLARLNQEKLPLNKIMISGLGEPLTDPRLFPRLRRLKRLQVPLRLYTNASLLTEKVAEGLVSLSLEELNISFNGATPATYQRVMGLNYAVTAANINRLVAIREKRDSKLPRIQLSLVITKENEKEISDYLARWSRMVESVTVSKAHEWGGAIKNKSKIKILRSQTTYPCRSLWHTLNIDSQGNFVICCRDYESRVVLGNLKTHSFKQVLNSPQRDKFQEKHLSYQEEGLPAMCRGCNFPYQGGVEWWLPRVYD